MELAFRAGLPPPVLGQGGTECAQRLRFQYENLREHNHHGQWGLVAFGQGQPPRYYHGQHWQGVRSQGME